MKDNSTLLYITMGIMYPFIIIFGLYIIINGATSPGGGFQGGGILASIFIIDYISSSNKDINLHLFNLIEKVLYICLIIFVIMFVFIFNDIVPLNMKQYYLAIMNILIGIKVCCGLSVVFYRFIIFETN